MEFHFVVSAWLFKEDLLVKMAKEKLILLTLLFGVHKQTTVTNISKNGRAKLSEADVLAIKAKRDSGVSFQKLADEYGVHKKTVMDAVSGKNWSRLTMPEPPKGVE